MPSTNGVRVRDRARPRDPTPLRINFTTPSAAPVVVKASGRGSTPPQRIGPFLVAPGDGIAIRHLIETHLPAGDLRQRFERRIALAAVDRGRDALALRILHRRFGAEAPGPLEVEAVWVAVRETLKSCGLTGVRIRVHGLADPSAGLAYGGVLVGFGRRGNAPEARHPLVVLKVRPHEDGRDTLAGEARALASVRAPLPLGLRDLVPTPLAHRICEGMEVLATGFVPGRAMPLELHPRRASPVRTREHLVAVSATLADLQASLKASGDRVVDGSVWPEGAKPYPWSAPLRERLAVRPVPLLASHGDFGPHNVLLDDGEPSGIVGWSRYREAALPTRDLFHFLLTYAGLADRPPARSVARIVRRGFIDGNGISRGVREALLRYGERREFGLPTLGGLFRLHLLVGDHRLAEQDRDEALRILDQATETVFTP